MRNFVSLLKVVITLLALAASFCSAKGMGAAMDTLVPKLLQNLPTISEEINNPRNSFQPVYGSVISSKAVAYSYTKEYWTDWLIIDCFGSLPSSANTIEIDSLPDAEQIYVDSTADSNTVARFLEWNEDQELTQQSLSSRGDENLKILHDHLVYRESGISIYRALLKVEIHVEKHYDFSTKEWVAANPKDSIATLYIPLKLGPHWIEKDGKVELRQYKFFIPSPQEKRFFFGDGFAQANSDKVLPYKYVFRVPENKIQDYRNELAERISERRYDEIHELLQKSLSYADSFPMFYGNSFDTREFEILEIASRHIINTTSLRDSNDHYLYIHPYKNYPSWHNDSLSHELLNWLRSNDYQQFVETFNDPFEKALALIYALSDKRIANSDLVESYVKKISNRPQQEYLVQNYWHRMEFTDIYIYFGFLGGGTTYLGKLGDYVGPAPGFGGIFGFGTKKFSVDIGVQSFIASNLRQKAEEIGCLKGKDTKEYEFGALDFFGDISHKLISLRHFEFAPYAGLTLNMTEIVKVKPNKDASESENRPSLQVSPGVDFGLSFSLFTAKTLQEAEEYLTGHRFRDGRWGTRIRIGASTQNAMDGLDAFGLKPYITIDFTLRAQLGVKPAEFDWSTVRTTRSR
ncbi:hypothetical protein [Fibrobacter sp. UWEL]|uniref:hypothetical protein n=1 Tax=Fibrobacter sp. UWEL TaxID=1896209 RepID=UPI0009150D89|nr:hypothetical protein [Fibrobacter sp. UWEL]SHL17192.1 hypothetical protein SAMN05720468_11577 [Fibrobacter sp. UWEL]